MKYIWFWEYDPKDIYKMFEKDNEISEERKKEPKRYPKLIMDGHWLGMENKGFTIYEVDDPQQLLNVAAKFFPEKKTKFVPIFEVAEVKKTFLKVKK